MLHLSKKILIGISLLIAYILTLQLSLFLTPPYPQLSVIVDSINRIQKNPLKINLPSLFTLPKITTISTSSNNQINTDNTSNWPFFSTNKLTPTPSTLSNLTPSNMIANQPKTPSTQPTTKNIFPTNNYPNIPNKTNTPIPPTTKPTNTPKPTKTPTPTVIKLQSVRPGKNFQDVAKILEPIICIPQAMIMATLTKEYGPWMNQVQADWTNRNTFKGSDSGETAPATQVMGVMQMMADTWRRNKPNVSAKLGNASISIDVTFDAMAAGAYHLRNVSLAMQDHIGCNDWPVKYILYGACRYNGACPGNTFGQTQYYNTYTYEVCNLYNQYTSGPKKNCH